MNISRLFLALLLLSGASACTTVSVDHVQLAPPITLQSGESMVILGRHHSAEYETEPSLVECVGQKIASDVKQVAVIPEKQFVDALYPYFEARTAPLSTERLKAIFDSPLVAQKLSALGLRYMVWIEGSTERTGSAGSMGCGISTVGGGCFGFGTWEDTSDYEAIIWDVQNFSEAARVSTEAIGTSYMPAFVVPVPLVARVQSNACQGMSTQLSNFFVGESSTLKVRSR